MSRLFSLLAGAAFTTLVACPILAHAQTTPTGTSTAGATSTSQTNVYPTSVPTTANGQVATDPSGYSPYNSHSTVDNQGIPHQAPALSLPSVYGLNPCSTGASVGVTTPLVGIGGAISSADPACEARNNAALAITAFHNELLAREVLCTRKEWREAWSKIGKPCIDDQRTASAATLPQTASAKMPPAQASAVAQMGVMIVPQSAAPAALVMTSQAAPQMAPQAIPAAIIHPASRTKPDWCATTAPSERNANYQRQCS